MKTLCKKINRFIYERGYKRAVNDHKKKIEELKQVHLNEIKNIEYDHETDLIERDRENKSLIEKIRYDQSKMKKVEEDKLVLKRKIIHLRKQTERLDYALYGINIKLAGPIREVLHISDEIKREIENTKKIEQ